ncbi:sigma-54 interaction domain-containing protein [Clostridium botulinum]|uniref:Sigma-54 dependent transcriptional regulator, Fis family n=1 Tax=Clostridium botulinum (strain Langeland / NCTC 10281 / Type F) TaxID=441772 RepID=A7GHC6_CLOBL|nr:sigma-54-dependent Fis family transcriptional regulator [Clostridium botulinum]ABS42825.1 sigma-54 dependent transcriptional regulator, Fis family [Clostridium botulinum F str. Langeland]KKM40938.1 ATPase AAA [Clostridium botulinum]MBY6792483.1 sigma-54-dependent Fis family transcriptional regulator [Clostridium botulinum]MBY6937875.1 sigma-54-dependent Fis family transcriptional regulator [Clostridium botulinum]MBY6945248.1 sigma-54-dependent Fis family transcriptional regulator [Clostridi
MYNHDEIIRSSHNRCMKYGIKKEKIFPTTIIKGDKFKLLLKKNNELIKVAKPFIKILYDFLKGSGFALYLTDKKGFPLIIIGDEDIIKDMAEMGIVEGADMSEESTGTNAIGTAIKENCSLQISGDEHYIYVYNVWTCSAAIIHNEEGNIIGCLNLTGRRQLVHPHSLGLVVAAVKSIENQLEAEKSQNELFKTYQYLNKVIDSINSGIFAVDTNGLIKAINNSACVMLNIKKENIINESVQNILCNWEYILDTLNSGKRYEDKEIIYSNINKKKRFNLTAYSIRNKNGIITEVVVMFKDMMNVYNLVNKYTGMIATYTFDDIVGKSEKFIKVMRQAKKISNSPSTVLIQGESGTGKELIAHSIHNNSNRKNNSFVAINCGAIPKSLIESELFGYEEGAFTGAKRGGYAGKFELASGGTLFLDEIGEMPLDMQVNLLRVLQEGFFTRIGGNRYINIDVRIIAATNKDLKAEVKKGTFREDLYYRLSVIPICVPPLRERPEDIEILIEHFLNTKSIKLNKAIPNIKSDIYEELINYSWPGNVREIENCIENIVNMDGNVSLNFETKFFDKQQQNLNRNNLELELCSLAQLEKKAIINCIQKCNGNVTKVSKILGINRSTLYSKIKKYNIILKR